MPLSDDQLERYARQIIVPGIGVQGQERLLAARVLVVGAPRGVAQASVYLRAAGVAVVPHTARAGAAGPGVVVVAGAEALSETERRELLASGLPLCWYALGAAGFTSGSHPQAPLPSAAAAGTTAAIDQALHDAAACHAAATACALIAGLPCRTGSFACDVGEA